MFSVRTIGLGMLLISKSGRDGLKHKDPASKYCNTVCFSRWELVTAPLLLPSHLPASPTTVSKLVSGQLLSPWSTSAEQGCWATKWFSQNWLLGTRSLMTYSETMLKTRCDCVGSLVSDCLLTPENIFLVTHYYHLLLSY